MKRSTVAAVALIVALAILLVVLLAKKDPPPQSARAEVSNTLTGAINITCSKGGCDNFAALYLNQPLALDSLTVNCDNVLAPNGQKYDCVKFGPLATGSTGRLTCYSASMDCVKIAGGHDLTIGGEGSTITCPTGNVNHKDGIQVVGPATDLTLVGIDSNCLDAGNAQLFVDGLDPSNPPKHIYFVAGKLHPDSSHFHTVTFNNSVSSGVIGSVICPNATTSTYEIGPLAVTPVDPHETALGNSFPGSC